MINIIRVLLNSNSQKISFNENNHEYTELVSGEYKVIPSSTQVLKNAGIGGNFVNNEAVQKAVLRGKFIHNIAESLLEWSYDNNDINFAYGLTKISYNENYYNDNVVLINRLLKELNKITNEGYEVVVAEQVVYDSGNKIAGTIDALFFNEKENKLLIVDWKTGNEKLSDYAQLAIYEWIVKKIIGKKLPNIKIERKLVYLKNE